MLRLRACVWLCALLLQRASALPAAGQEGGLVKAGIPSAESDCALLLEDLLPKARQGDERAQVLAGLLYSGQAACVGRAVRIDYAAAVSWFRQAADQRYPEGQFRLGAMCGRGWGVPKDSKEEAKWMREAALLGHAKAQVRLSNLYRQGEGVPRDEEESAGWRHRADLQSPADAPSSPRFNFPFLDDPPGTPKTQEIDPVKWRGEASVEFGDAYAAYLLGLKYLKGHGVPLDPAAAAKLFAQAGDAGAAHAQTGMGYLFQTGKGVPQDHLRAAGWYRKAAEQGDSAGQLELAVATANGLGPSKDPVEAMKWFILCPYSANSLERTQVESSLSKEDLGRAGELAEAERKLIEERKAAKQPDSSRTR
ncbi:MAG: tetratricopeptide repeat protein [candidate division NC10 bacterium]